MVARRKPRSHLAAADASIAALALDVAADAALIELVRGLARAVDLEPGNASLWREYRAGLAVLFERGTAVDDGEGEVVALLRAPLRDPAAS